MHLGLKFRKTTHQNFEFGPKKEKSAKQKIHIRIRIFVLCVLTDEQFFSDLANASRKYFFFSLFIQRKNFPTFYCLGSKCENLDSIILRIFFLSLLFRRLLDTDFKNRLRVCYHKMLMLILVIEVIK